VGLISLNERFTIPNIPSKTLDYFNVGLPVLASIDRATDYNVILDEASAGLWSYAGNHDSLMRNFESLYNDPELRRRMAQNGRDYFIRHLTPDKAYNTIINSLN
jgi:glycosyltransferase involved in cell wall biosynthesis